MSGLTGIQISILAEMAAEADGGCISCCTKVIYSLTRAFPGYDWAALAVEHAEFGLYWSLEEMRERVDELLEEGLNI